MATTRDFAPTKDGLKLRYEIRGSGDPLALIMGFSGSSRGWGEPFLSRIEKRFKTVLIDNRGTGESDKPDAPWTMTDMADDVAAVLDHAKIPRAHIYGISMGGMIAQEFALSIAARVRGLVLGCTTCGMQHGAPNDPENVAKLMPDPKLSAEGAGAARVFSRMRHRVSQLQRRDRPSSISRSPTWASIPSRRCIPTRDRFEAIQGWDPYDRLGQIKAPTLIIPWRRRHASAASRMPRSCRRESRVRRCTSLKASGHMFFWEAPEESVNVPGDFVAAVK